MRLKMNTAFEQDKAHTPIVKGWCPGALTPMASGDGLLLRAKIVGSRLSLAAAGVVAGVARDFGNGGIDLSQRAQLQLRGVSEATLSDARARLDAAGLLAPDATTEASLNTLSSPWPGPADALVDELAHALAREAHALSLPGKFLFLVDDGGPLPMRDVAADIRLEIGARDVVIVVDGARDFGVRVAREDAVSTALALAKAFVALRAERPFARRRMRALVAELGAECVYATAGLRGVPYHDPCEAPPFDLPLGARVIGAADVAGVAAPYGRFSAAQLLGLVETTATEGCDELRLTPWRAVLIPAPSAQAAARIVAAAHAQGFIVDREDPRLAVVACPGAPECEQALGATRTQLQALAPVARRLGRGGVGLHVSGCAKGCAKPSATAATLVARDGGAFDLVFDGVAGDAPFVRGVALDAALSLIAARAAEAAE
jgi:precorrin-3B synthase